MTLQVYLAIIIAVSGSALGFVAFAVAWVVRPRSQEEKKRAQMFAEFIRREKIRRVKAIIAYKQQLRADYYSLYDAGYR